MSSITVRLGCRIAALLLLLGCSGAAQDDQKRQVNTNTPADSAKITAGQPAIQGNASKVAPTDSEADMSVIWIVADQICALVLTDPANRRAGYDPRTNLSLKEIPSSSGYEEYIEDPMEEGAGMGSNQIVINRPVDGNYQLTVTGTKDGTYELSIVAYNAAGEQSAWSQKGIAIATNTTNAYKLRFDKTSPTASLVSGGFEGAAQPGEANGLLSYATVSGSVTVLPAGTESFGLLIFYAPTLIPETLSATLDDGDISNLFKPAAGQHQIVTIPLHPGKNVLRLGAMGTDGNDKTLDEDVLEFVIE